MSISLDRRRRHIPELLLFALLCCATDSHAQVFEVLSSFRGCTETAECSAGSDGVGPRNQMIVGPDGSLYGTTSWDGERPAVLYRVSPAGTRTNIGRFYDISGTEYCDPTGTLAVGTDGGVYGVARGCGDINGGILFRMQGTSLEVLHRFTTVPSTGLARGADGKLYGAAGGFIFRWDGSLSIVQVANAMGDLSLGPDGSLYWVWVDPVVLDAFNVVVQGVINRMRPNYAISTVFRFDLRENLTPGVLPASDGYLYGSTHAGNPFLPEDGNTTWLYKVGLDGSRANLRDITANATLAEGLNGAIYGTTNSEGEFGGGTIFRLLPGVSFTPLHSFGLPRFLDGSNYLGGSRPSTGLTRGPDGHLYGTTFYGGEHDLGVVFRLRMPAEADISANGRQGPLTLTAGNPLQISVAFHAGETNLQSDAEVYLAVVTPWGAAYWMQPDQSFSVQPTRLYAGELPSFGPAPFVNVPLAGALPAGDYYWVLIVDADRNGVPDGTFVDYVKTTRR